jgi:hypothetical protein
MSKNKNQSLLTCLLTTGLGLCLVIGLPTYIMGCSSHESDSPRCPVQHVYQAQVLDGWVTHDSCQGTCLVRTALGNCVSWHYYDCYRTHIELEYSDRGRNRTCSAIFLETKDPAEAERTRLDLLDAWLQVFVNQQGHCEVDGKMLKNVWITGVAFLSAAALTLLTLAGLALQSYCAANRTRTTALTANATSGTEMEMTEASSALV